MQVKHLATGSSENGREIGCGVSYFLLFSVGESFCGVRNAVVECFVYHELINECVHGKYSSNTSPNTSIQ